MSANIQGWRIGLSFDEAYRRLVDEVKPALGPVGVAGLNKAQALLIATEFDEISAGMRDIKNGETTASSLASRTYRSICERQREIVRSGYRDHDVDHNFEIMLYPHGDAVLAIPNCEQDYMRQVLLDLPWIEDYSWWNGSDRPKRTTASEWKDREKIWEHHVPNTLADRGLKLSLFDGRFELRSDPDLMWNSMPTDEARLKTLGENVHVNRNYDHSRGISQVFDLLTEYRQNEQIRGPVEDDLRPAIVRITPGTALEKRI